ncbi:hypothetical protein EGJ28_21095 [Stutzerimonas xanthomarina]|uniref:Uncharacterized protein n=1 Tax=Stutzerimonas xanthomarina TaxID=271420 RepID=A0A3R8TXL5_9GAMM|nr:hypothetical protein EGJ28_21095 [Stutzerimonas xanthomarina]
MPRWFRLRALFRCIFLLLAFLLGEVEDLVIIMATINTETPNTTCCSAIVHPTNKEAEADPMIAATITSITFFMYVI